jgi:hypothetical protein
LRHLFSSLQQMLSVSTDPSKTLGFDLRIVEALGMNLLEDYSRPRSWEERWRTFSTKTTIPYPTSLAMSSLVSKCMHGNVW